MNKKKEIKKLIQICVMKLLCTTLVPTVAP